MSTFQKILVTTDFSDNASVIYDFTREIAKNFEAKIDLIYIISEPHFFPVGLDFKSFPVDKPKNAEFKDIVEENLETELNDKIPEEYRGKTIIKTGKPADAIRDCAKEGGYDLIMIASRGEGNSLFNKGSVTEKLMRISHTPVLSVLNDSETDFKRITVPTDGSDISFEALPLAHSLAVKQNSEIDLLSISKADFTHIMAGENTPYVHKDAEIKEYIFKALQEFIKSKTSQLYFKEEPISSDETFQLKDQKGNNVRISIVVKKGNSAHLAVVDYAEKNAQLVVMATHGYSKLTSMFVGSTTESVFRNLKIPILTVKPDFAK